MDKVRSIINKIGFVTLLLLPAFLLQFAAQSNFVVELAVTVKTYLVLYVVVVLVLKAVSIIYPPLPGVVFTLASVPLIGWQLAYIIDIAGSVIGATASFLLGKKYGYWILRKILGSHIADKIAKIKLKQKNQVEAAIFLRFAAGGMLSDGLAWGASLIGFKFTPFMIGYAISHVITTLPVFFFISASVAFESWIIVAIAAVLAWLIIYKFKGRYLE